MVSGYLDWPAAHRVAGLLKMLYGNRSLGGLNFIVTGREPLPMPITILLVDDHKVFRDALRRMLEGCAATAPRLSNWPNGIIPMLPSSTSG